MRLRFFGGLAVDHDGEPIDVRGRGQEALLFRLALDTGTTVLYRALAEDVWPADPPDDPRAALQSLASRLRRALPTGALEAVSGGYRLTLPRADIDVTRFQDLVAAARLANDPVLAREALELWCGDPWTPAGFDWVVRDLLEDRAHAERVLRAGEPLGRETAPGPRDVASDAQSRGADAVSRGGAAAPPLPSAIPAPLSPLVGRADELALIRAQLEENRLVTLVGPGGAGKTTLALETARAVSSAVFVELAPAAPGEVWGAVAAALGRSIRLSETSSAPLSPRDRVLLALPGRSVLLVLDNAEHVVAETAGVVHEILRAAPTVRVLATSREPLGVAAEAFVELGPLPEEDAVDLLSRRIRAARGAGPEDAEREAVARIARRLDGLPLALELAAAKSRTLSIAELEEGLSDRFALLGSGPRTAEARHQTLRALIDWSWELLDAAEQRALLMLAVFPDGLAAADAPRAAAAFAADSARLAGLVDRSLVQRVHGRYRLLETVREYGLDALRRAGALDEFRDRQARAIAELAAAADPLLRTAEVRDAVAWFDADDENLSAAMRWCVQRGELAATGILLTRAQFWVWLMRERFDALGAALERFAPSAARLDSEASVVVAGAALVVEAMRDTAQPPDLSAVAARADEIAAAAAVHRSELTATLPALMRAAVRALRSRAVGQPWSVTIDLVDDELPGDAPEWSRAFVAVMRAAIAQNNGAVDRLGAESERALAAFERVGDIWGIALSSQMRSEWLTLQGRLAEALEVADAATAGLEGLTSVWDLIQQRTQGLMLLVRLGRVDEARARLAEIEAVAAEEGSDRALQQAASTAAALEIALGDGAAALRAFERSTSAPMTGFPEQVLAWGEAKRAQALVLVGELDAAREHLRAAVPMAVRTGDQPILAEVALAVGGWFAAAGRLDDARAALAESDRLRGRRDRTDPVAARLARALGQDTRDDVRDEGADAAASAPSDLTALAARL